MKKALVLLLALLPMWVYAQTDIQLSQQLFSRVNYNPAATGASNYINMFLLARQQWVGFRGAPRTQIFNAHNYFDEIKSGMGLTLSNDKTDLINSINAKLAYAYHIHFGDNSSYLSLGLSAGMLYKSFDVDRAILEDLFPDHIIESFRGRNTQVSPDFDFGIEFNTKRFQIGLSTTHLSSVPKKIEDIRILESSKHFYAYTKYIFDIDRDWKFVPILMGVNNQNTFSFEVNGMAYYKERFWFGASYRLSEEVISESVIGMVGLFITDFLRLGYSYDFNIGALKSHSSGTHEIMLSLRLAKNDYNYGRKSPRFFE